jgi:hypothetical protein
MEDEELAQHSEGRKNHTVLVLPDPCRIVDKTIRHQLGSGAERPGNYRGANGRSEPYVGLTTRKRKPRTGARGASRLPHFQLLIGRQGVSGDGGVARSAYVL